MDRISNFLIIVILLISSSCSSVEDEVINQTQKFTLSVESSDGGTVSTSGGTYEEGSTITITATPYSEYVFQNWSNGSTNNPLTVTVNQNITLTSNFIKRKYPLTISIEGEGTVREEVVSSGKSTPTEYNSGTTVLLTAHPEDEWLFTGWSGDIGDIDPTENPIQFNITESKNITATFLNDVNNYFKIGENRFSIGRVASNYYSNSITCDKVPAFYNHDLTFYSETENEEIYIEFFNNDSDQFKPGEYLSVFSYLNPYFGNQFDDYDQMLDYIDNLSNQELYNLYLSKICSDSEYKLMSIVEIEFQDYYYEVDLEENFKLDIDLDNETYTVSMTGYLRQGSYNLSSEKVELFYIGNLNFEDYSGDDEAEEINDLLSSNDQNSYDLNILYDSNFNLDGTFKTEESVVSSSRPLYLIDDNLLYYLRGYNAIQSKLFTSNNNYLDFDADDGDPLTYPDYLEGNIIQNDEGYFNIFLIDSDNQIYRFGKRKLNFDRLESLSEITIDLTNFGPDEYFSKRFRFRQISSDNLNNLYLNVEMIVQDVYTGETQNSSHLIKYNPLTMETIWSKEYPSSFTEIISGNMNYGFFNNKQNIMFYGFNTANSSTWFKIYNSNTGELIYEDILTEFSSGGIVVNGFYEDSNHLFLYGEYGFTYVINKSSFTHDLLYTYTYGSSDFCGDYPVINGFNKFNENYVILSNVQKNDQNEGTFSIDIRDDQGNLLNSFSIDNTGTPQHLFKLSDDTFLIVGSKEMCINETLGPRSRIIKFELTESKSNNDDKNSYRFFKLKIK